MKRRDLNPGDVFVYVTDPWGDIDEEGMIRYAVGEPSWFDGATPSPNDGGYLPAEVLDADVVLLQKPEGRLETRGSIKDGIDCAMQVLQDLRDSI